MSKIGISIRIDVSKVNKARLFQGEKGLYLDLTTFIDLDNQDQYGNNGFIAEAVSQDERQQNIQGTILGNCKVFYRDQPQQGQYQPPQPQQGQYQPQQGHYQPQQGQQGQMPNGGPDDCPF